MTHTKAVGVKEADVYHSLIQYLKSLYDSGKSRQGFNELLSNIFGQDRLVDPSFLHFLAKQLCANYSNFKRSIRTWLDGGMNFRKRGQKPLSQYDRQVVYDIWIEHSVTSTDNRKDRSIVQISKLEYLKRYDGIEHKTVHLEEKRNKRGRVNMCANRMIVTKTVVCLFALKGVIVNDGSMLNLKPFLWTYASENMPIQTLLKIKAII